MVTAMRHLALALLFVVACSSAPAPTRCTPGASVACVCPGVGTGAQVCAADGSSYSACACGVDAGGDTSVTPGADATSVDVAVAVVDAPALDAGGGEDRPAAVDAVAVADAGPVRVCGDASVNVVEGTYLSTGPNGGRFTNCGACGVLCASSQRCTAGACGPRCPNGERAMCDGRRVDLVLGELDGGVVANCGACGNTCPAGWLCDGCVCARP